MHMTIENATALRKPFPKSAIGILPKPYKKDSPRGNCTECGGYHGLPAVHLDYVGHAATTDRLLSVDPEWSWAPLALDEHGLPALDRSGNLWIKLTVCGVTRIGVGDGKSAKEVIGDSIRNAAMRFGVALDLWSKEELEQAREPASRPAPAATPPAESRKESPYLDTKGALAKRMFAAIRDSGVTEDNRLRYISDTIGREVASSKEMTDADAGKIIDALAKTAAPEPEVEPEETQ